MKSLRSTLRGAHRSRRSSIEVPIPAMEIVYCASFTSNLMAASLVRTALGLHKESVQPTPTVADCERRG